ncbi:MAG: Smr/MutS family protein [Bacteroidia bacterium]|nr:Smr/MutS family protein [Bacteroidia bacterium]
MFLSPADTLEKLEFDKILKLLEKHALSEVTQSHIQDIQPSTSSQSIFYELTRVHQYKLAFENNDVLPIRTFKDITEHLDLLKIEGYVLSEEVIISIFDQLLIIRDILNFFKEERKTKYDQLYRLFAKVEIDHSLLNAFEQIFDEEGEIKPNASPTLVKISKSMKSRQVELDKRFRIILTEYKAKGWLTDIGESIRNGRRVLSVRSESKRKIRGIIHDESATGNTAFIEPDAIVQINNDILDLMTAFKKEVYKLLRDLCTAMRPFADDFVTYQKLLVKTDLIRAKALLAISMDGEIPNLLDQPKLNIKIGHHPLLLLKHKKEIGETVPFTLSFKNGNRILLLSGPNAGGKSIAMKAVGLLQVMVQSGMLVPADANSEFGIFHQLFVDIGDSQSLDDDLSTYSSRLKNMKLFIEKANERTLVLIDEFGSGTDPQMGGAIAESILKELNFRKVSGVITTHYSNLKIFVFKARGIVNGAMLFDTDSLKPTYRMKIGRPGSSFAFEIADKSGLSKRILDYAKYKSGKKAKAIDQLLVELQSEKKALEDELEEMKLREKNLERLIRNYESLQLDMTVKKKRMKLENKEKELQDAASDNKLLEKVIREIKEAQNLQRAKELAEKKRREKEKLKEEVTELKETIFYKDATAEEINKGDFVRLRTGGAAGKVLLIEKDIASVQIGQMRMSIPIRDLTRAAEPLAINPQKGIQTDVLKKAASAETNLDIRGMRRNVALQVVEEFVDTAIIANVDRLKIIHGRGNGILKKAVWEKLKEYRDIQRIYHPDFEAGGDGVTIIKL